MSRSRRAVWALGVGLCLIVAGALLWGPRARQAPSPQLVPAQLLLPLATLDAQPFRLRGAVFDIANAAGKLVLSLDSDSDPDAVALDGVLAQGDYTITLNDDGWSIERDEGGGAAALQATLVPPNPRSFSIGEGRVTEVAYSFETEQGTITLGQLHDGASNRPAAPIVDCNVLDRSSCGAGKTCLLRDSSGGTFCGPIGAQPVGAECRGQACVAGAQCLAVDPAQPQARRCVRFCDPASRFCGCQALPQIQGVGVCREPSGIAFEYDFASTTGSAACEPWNAFRGKLEGAAFARVTLAGSRGGSFECTDEVAATQICKALHDGEAASIRCQDHTWTTGNCEGVELSVDAKAACECSEPGNAVRPCRAAWGGVGTATCNNVPQVLQVTCAAKGTQCGDGIVNGGEQCDGSAGLGACPDGTFGGPRCSSTCKLDTSSCTTRDPATCDSCTKDHCAELSAACSEDNPSGPKGACSVVLECARRTGCADADPTICYCGVNATGGVDIAECLGGAAKGDCKDVIRQQSGCIGAANEPQCIFTRLNDTDYGMGDAFQIYNCQRANCAKVCGLSP